MSTGCGGEEGVGREVALSASLSQPLQHRDKVVLGYRVVDGQ